MRLAFAFVNRIDETPGYQTKYGENIPQKEVKISRPTSQTSLTLLGATYPIRLGFAFVNALAKRQVTK